jgi:hypothetical protein
MLNLCYPDGKLQERGPGAPYFVARHGPDVLEILLSRVDVARFEHCIIQLD